MTNNHNPKNPFKDNEDWQYWFNLDPDFVSKKKRALNKFFQTHNYSISFFMSLKTKFTKLIHIFTANAVVATISVILIGGTIGVSAAEILAPTEYKPSTFIQKYSQNKQEQKDPFTALAPDTDNSVVSIPDCNLALKYPKQVGNLKTSDSVETMVSTQFISDKEYFDSIGAFMLSTEQTTENKKSNQIYTHCFKKVDYQKLSPKKSKENSATKEQVFKETGWFIFEADLQNFEDITFESDDFKYDNKYINLLERNVKFEFQDLVYEVSYTPRALTINDFDTKDTDLLTQFKQRGELDIPGIFGNQIQLQFNSIVTNTFSEIPKSASSSSNNSSSNSSPISKNNTAKITRYLPKELTSQAPETKNNQQPFKVIDGKTYWVEPITGKNSCNESSDISNCGNDKLMTLENGKSKTLLEFKGSELSSLKFLSSQSVDGQLYIYNASGFGGGNRVDTGILFNPKTGKITKDEFQINTDEERSLGVWNKNSISSKIAAKDFPLYASKKAWPTVFSFEKYFGIKDGLQYGRVSKTVEFGQNDEPFSGEYWIAINNGKEVTYLYKTELLGTSYEGNYTDELKINSRGNLVNIGQYNSYKDAGGKTILIENYTFIEQDLVTAKIIQKTEQILAKDKAAITKKYE